MNNHPLKILVVTARTPEPIDGGDRIRLNLLLNGLKRNGYDFDLFVADQYINKKRLTTKAINIILAALKSILLVLPLQATLYGTRKVRRAVKKKLDQYEPDLILCHLARCHTLIPKTNIPILLELTDAVSMSYRRIISPKTLREYFLKYYEGVLMKKFEDNLIKDCKRTILVSKIDAAYYGSNKSIHIIPNPVDDLLPRENYTRKDCVVMLANFRSDSNHNAAMWLITEIWPRVQVECPNVRLKLVGANPRKQLLYYDSDKINITGWVDDVLPYIYQSDLTVCPLNFSAGIQNKVLQSLNTATPVVSTSFGYAAIKDIVSSGVAIGDSADSFAKQIIYLLNNEQARMELGKKGYAEIRSHLSYDDFHSNLNKAILESVEDQKLII